MDGIDSYRQDPLYWAALVVLDHIDKDDPEQLSENHLHSVLVDTGAYEFIEFSFEEEGLGKPSKTEIISKALEMVAD